jgi:type I restriction enzyme, S subunit
LSHIANLIQEYCPNGVEHRQLGSMIKLHFGARITKMKDAGTLYPVYGGGGASFRTDQFNREDEYVVSRFAISANCVRKVSGKFWMLDSGFTFEPIDESIDKNFVAYLLFNMQPAIYACSSHGAQKNLKTEEFKKLLLPVPPVVVQREIVRVLDLFTTLEAELESTLATEAEARRDQHAHYRSRVLGLRELSSYGESGGVLSELVDFINGKPHERLVSPDGTIALLTARFISTAGKSARWVKSEDDLTPARRGDIAMVMSDLPNGRALARCFYVEEDGKYTANQRVCLLRVRDGSGMDARYLYRFLDRNPQLLAFDNGQDQTHLKKGQILGIRVPVVPFNDQQHAVSTLDRLDAGNRDLVSALQTEQEARHKQYEYYRDRLLTFEGLAT